MHATALQAPQRRPSKVGKYVCTGATEVSGPDALVELIEGRFTARFRAQALHGSRWPRCRGWSWTCAGTSDRASESETRRAIPPHWRTHPNSTSGR
jgi:hypothetical protein